MIIFETSTACEAMTSASCTGTLSSRAPWTRNSGTFSRSTAAPMSSRAQLASMSSSMRDDIRMTCFVRAFTTSMNPSRRHCSFVASPPVDARDRAPGHDAAEVTHLVRAEERHAAAAGMAEEEGGERRELRPAVGGDGAEIGELRRVGVVLEEV